MRLFFLFLVLTAVAGCAGLRSTSTTIHELDGTRWMIQSDSSYGNNGAINNDLRTQRRVYRQWPDGIFRLSAEQQVADEADGTFRDETIHDPFVRQIFPNKETIDMAEEIATDGRLVARIDRRNLVIEKDGFRLPGSEPAPPKRVAEKPKVQGTTVTESETGAGSH